MLNFRNHVLRSAIPGIAAGFILLLPSGTGARQERGRPSESLADTLAIVGPRAITARDLIERIELMPWPGKDSPAFHDSAKVRALQSLVAEELLALAGAEAGIGDEPHLVERAAELERILVRDELYRRDVLAKVTVTDADIRTGLQRYGRVLKLAALATRSREDALTLSALLTPPPEPGGERSRRIGQLVLRRDTAEVSFGRLEEPFEDAAYRLTPAHPASPPLSSHRGEWFVFLLLSAGPDPRVTPGSPLQQQTRVEQIIRQRREQALGRTYAEEVLRPQRAAVDPGLFEILASTMLSVFRSDSTRYRVREGYSIAMVADTVSLLTSAHANGMLVSLESGGLTLSSALATYRYFNFVIPSLDPKTFRAGLNQSLREIVATEYLAREGYRRGLENSAEVRQNLGLWRRHWIAGEMQDRLVASAPVGEGDVSAYLQQHASEFGRWYEVNIREVLSDSLLEALSVLRRGIAGEPLEAMARAESRRREWAPRGGESGYFRVSERPALGFAALDADSGLAGPIALKEGYSVFTLLGRRIAAGEAGLPYDTLRASVTKLLKARAGEDLLHRSLARWAGDRGVRIHYEKLSRVPILPASMVTKRFIGFGGSMLAAPGLVPRWQWIGASGDLEGLLP